MARNYMVRKLSSDDLPEALQLIWDVFIEYDAPEYPEEGVGEFRSFIELTSIKRLMVEEGLLIWGAFDKDKEVGVIAVKPPCHIVLLFVNKYYHRKGIARALYEEALCHQKEKYFCRVATVNSSPYAIEAYRRLGFMVTGAEQTVNGLRFTPMQYVITNIGR